MNRKLNKICLTCQKYKEIDIIEFLNSHKSVCNNCKLLLNNHTNQINFGSGEN